MVSSTFLSLIFFFIRPPFSGSCGSRLWFTKELYIAASQMAQQMSQMNPGAGGAPGLFQPGQDPDKMFKGEAENLQVVEHWCVLDGIENRLLRTI